MMHDEKYEIRDGKVFHKLGGYEIPEDEPLIIFRGKDPASVVAMLAYIEHESALSHNEEAAMHAKSMKRKLAEVVEWQNANPHRVRRGCHKCP